MIYSSAARMYKVLAKTHTYRIDIILKPDGFMTENAKQILEGMMKTPVPGSVMDQTNNSKTNTRERNQTHTSRREQLQQNIYFNT